MNPNILGVVGPGVLNQVPTFLDMAAVMGSDNSARRRCSRVQVCECW